MTYDQLIDRLIFAGIAEVREAYADPEEHHKRDGAIEGFEACRGKTPGEIVALWREVEKESIFTSDTKEYWKHRYKALQLEWTLNVISAGLVNSGAPPLLGHLPTARGVMQYARLACGTESMP